LVGFYVYSIVNVQMTHATSRGYYVGLSVILVARPDFRKTLNTTPTPLLSVNLETVGL